MSNSTLECFDEHIFPLTDVSRFIEDCLVAVGIPLVNAKILANALTKADYIGFTCDGLQQLGSYIDDIVEGGCNKHAVPTVVKQTSSTALVDGQSGLGAVIGDFCINLAIDKAQKSGIGWVVAKNSNNFGLGGLYSLKAANENLLSIVFTNTSPMVAPNAISESFLGTNPIAMSAPALNHEFFFMDVTTSAASQGKIESLSIQKKPIPKTWANPKTGLIRPLGYETNSTQIGISLAMFVDILCGVLSGSAFGPDVKKYKQHGIKGNLSHCFIVVNPIYFEIGFNERLSSFLQAMRSMNPTGCSLFYVPGDLEKKHMDTVDREGGVQYNMNVISRCGKLARKLNVKPLTPLK